MNNFAHLKQDCPWRFLFPRGMVPVRNIILPSHGEMLGDGFQDFYEVDVAKLEGEQIRAIADLVAKQCGGTAAEVESDMRLRGFIPLRAKHISAVSSDSPFFL